jgi:hypothetical protein
LAGLRREVLAAEATPALEHADPLAGFGEAARGNAAPEARADDNGVI